MDIVNVHTGTCEWVFTHSVYRTWLRREDLAGHNGILWIRGKPGSGKSTLLKHVLGRIQKLFRNSALILSFFFNARGDTLERSAAGFYRSLLCQILKQHRRCPSELLSKYQEKQRNGENVQWHYTELRDCLRTALLQQGHHPIYLFVDALDECQETQQRHNHAPWEEIVLFLEDLASSGSDCSLINICVSRRHFPNLPDKPLEIPLDGLNGGDIEKYLQAHLNCFNEFDDTIRKTLVQKARGIFLWVVLVVASLNRSAYNPHSRKELTHILETIPEDLETIFRRISDNFSPQHRESSQKLFQWVLFAKRPLSVAELTYGLACTVPHHSQVTLESGEDFVSVDRMEQRIIFLSGGLIEVSQVTPRVYTRKSMDRYKSLEESRVQFIHESVRDHFLSGAGWSSFQSSPTTSNVAGAGHEMLKASCINYLLLEEVLLESTKLGSFRREKESTAMILGQTYPFFNYATRFVFYHASWAEKSGLSQSSLGERFLDPSDNFFEIWAAFMLQLTDAPRKYLEGKSAGLSVLVDLGILTSLRAVHEGHGALGSRNRHGWTSLHLAAEKGHFDLVQLLLDGQVDIDPRSVRGTSPLMLAAAEGHWQIVNVLLDAGADVNARSVWGTSLTRASLAGHGTTAKLLLERGADVNAGGLRRNTSGTELVTPLQAAVDAGHQKIVMMLLDKGADANAVGGVMECLGSLRTAYSGNPAVPRMLLNKETDINDHAPITALQKALKRCNINIARILLDRGANVDADGPEGTALFIAASRNENAIAALQLLLEHGAEVNLCQSPKDCPSYKYETALHAAARSGNADAVLFLLSNGAEINTPSKAERTVIELALSQQNHVIFDLLLEKGADTEKLKDPRSALLSRAAGDGNNMVIRRLLLLGVDVNSADTEASPLCWAASHKQITSVQLLLEHGAKVDRYSGEWGTALLAAVWADDLPIALLLLQRGTDVNLSGSEGSALSSAVEVASEEMVSLLLSHGAQINQETYDSLARAVENGRQNILRLILETGVDVDMSHPVFLVGTAKFGQNDMVGLLLAHGADVNGTAETKPRFSDQFDEKRVVNPLSAAARSNRRSTVRLLLDQGADPNACGGLALCTAAFEGFQDIIDLLLQEGAKVNVRGGEYETPLIATVAGLSSLSMVGNVESDDHEGFEAIARLLLKDGVDPNVRSEKYGTAMDVATAGGEDCYIMKRLLAEHGATVS